ncbi:Plasmodium exported protein, unknown function [Plasmodium chabaudi chabaudi]|uniref:Fam-m protein n=1 Tax=Plasmodium chabaudi chabaudi TaxID=31271 RepID=A0A077TKX6_PLACU|nr:Plasmodium exported protein, unknown function [Plasmodium chabaudi chabaudi]SCM21658.1 Plasmodium exported protein, unknown function [Plasmodium chabaudi chabaudi]SCN60001.1 Plasmodium exported protein, unknown function [Plasmodium chabaudi chabaudi]VTZ68577.1 Plasmodium exported protein, unknown function [Plasmodium chabaudi chabaudi]|eukprot:XP_744705.2 Plasmodium exported protein, unknown function [Plasmodium chabaudi chabaudi]
MRNYNFFKIALFIFSIWICLYYNNENGIGKSLNRIEDASGLSSRNFYRILGERECKKRKSSKRAKELEEENDDDKQHVIKLTIDVSHDRLIAIALLFGTLITLLNIAFSTYMFLNKSINMGA